VFLLCLGGSQKRNKRSKETLNGVTIVRDRHEENDGGMITFIGENLLQGVAGANGGTHIATVFPQAGVVVTLPGIHCTQREAYVERAAAQRREQGLSAMTAEEHDRLMLEAVDLIIKEDKVLIRPDPEHMDLAFDADTVLQEVVPKRRIHFLFVSDPRVRNAISRRGAAWRIHAPPRSTGEIQRLIAGGRISAGGQAIYYYNLVSGTRYLTCEQFAQLGALADEELRRHLCEIAGLANRCNVHGCPQLRSFMVQGPFRLTNLARVDWAALPAVDLRRQYGEEAAAYQAAVTPGFEHDDLEDASWRNHMYEALCGRDDDELSETDQLGLSAEYFRQVEWLPGARIEGGEIIFDALGEEECTSRDADCDRVVHGLICNLLQEQTDVDFINIGRLVHSLSLRDKPADGRREVYLEHFRQTGAAQDTLQLIRMQKWGVREHLDEGKDLLQAMIECEEYTAYIMDRRLGCRQLGMNIAPRMSMRKVAECYHGRQTALHGRTIWSPYFQREYFVGAASDKIPPRRLQDPRFALALARLLGEAAAPNLILGRCSAEGKVIFDDGDEVVIADREGLPQDIVVADHTSTFGDYLGELERAAPAYARAVQRRAALVPDAAAFGHEYVAGFTARFTEIQRDYLDRQRAFDRLFRHRQADPAGNLAFRWKLVLARLARAKVDELAAAIRKALQQG
jgi:hypothetical protein